MKTAAIVLDSWKLPYFKAHLDETGFTYTEHPGITEGTAILKVDYTEGTFDLLHRVVRTANKTCREMQG